MLSDKRQHIKHKLSVIRSLWCIHQVACCKESVEQFTVALLSLHVSHHSHSLTVSLIYISVLTLTEFKLMIAACQRSRHDIHRVEMLHARRNLESHSSTALHSIESTATIYQRRYQIHLAAYLRQHLTQFSLSIKREHIVFEQCLIVLT